MENQSFLLEKALWQSPGNILSLQFCPEEIYYFLPPEGHCFLPFQVFLNYMDLPLLVPRSTADPLITVCHLASKCRSLLLK